MKTLLIILTASVLAAGCQEAFLVDTTPPVPPRNIWATALDNAIELTWDANPEPDVAGYSVWVSDRYDGEYTLIASTSRLIFTDTNLQNGVRMYYAITAYDFEGNESDLSRDVVYATPRPEGYGIRLNDYRTSPNTGGYDFSTYSVGKFNDDFTDVFFEYFEGRLYFNVWDDTDIQDMGYTSSLYDIYEAPEDGWAPSRSVQVIPGHTYVIWTWDDHYAKIRVREVDSYTVRFDWAYQVAPGNPDLKKQLPKDGKRNIDRTNPIALMK
ncbi:MAG: hypothetical protein HYZ01_11815 [Ignavibacteriales bacterium]|nr:hypothetical protein [Ignavibacteriales bacterium]